LKKIANLALLSVALFVLSGCLVSQAPVTGRTQLVLLSADKEKSLGLSEAEAILSNATLSSNQTLNTHIADIGKRIVAASPEAQEYTWDFYVIESETINAFALPGGKVFFYTGILTLMDNDAQIATVMGHEIAHVLAHHGAERISQQMLASYGGDILGSVLGIPSQYQGLYNTAYGIAANLGVILPFSRTHESEADIIGINLMHKAGYDPNESVKFWQKMSAASSGATPEFLSTHPSDETRIKEIREYIQTLK
jgi:predicted Zn-dependent protease